MAPILFGLDKFANVMTDWPKYLAGQFNDLTPGDAHQAMLMVGVIEIVAGLLVALRPRIGAYVVALWLLGIIVNLLLLGGYGDVALRDFGLLLAVLRPGATRPGVLPPLTPRSAPPPAGPGDAPAASRPASAGTIGPCDR